MMVDNRCKVCGVEMTLTSAWEADDADRAVQGMMRFICPSCAGEGVLMIRKDDNNTTSGRLELIQR